MAEAKAECSRYFIALSFNSKGHLGFFDALPIRRASFLVAMGIVEGEQSFLPHSNIEKSLSSKIRQKLIFNEVKKSCTASRIPIA